MGKKVMYMLEMKSLFPPGCTKDEAERYADWVCDYIDKVADLRCGSHADVIELDEAQVEEISPITRRTRTRTRTPNPNHGGTKE
jgi:hypothetical protein